MSPPQLHRKYCISTRVHVSLQGLDRQQIGTIVRLQAKRVADRLASRKIRLELDDSAVEFLADKVPLPAALPVWLLCMQALRLATHGFGSSTCTVLYCSVPVAC